MAWRGDSHEGPARPRSAWQRALAALATAALLALAPAPLGAAEEPFASLARDILSGLESTGAAPWRGAGRRGRIAVWPFSADDVPVSPARAAELNDALLAALIEEAGDVYTFVARRELGTVILELEESGEGLGDPVAAVATAAAADVLIVGRIVLTGGRASLGYKALGVAGEVIGAVLAVATPRAIALDPHEARLSLDQGIAQAARKFADRAGDMEELRLAGVRFQTTRVQTPFGGYVEGKVADALVELFANVITGRKLKVGRAELAEARLAEMRGADVTAKALRPESFDARPGVYVLSGGYWDFGRAVELRLALRDGAGGVVAWRDLVEAPPGLALRPPGEFPLALLDNDGLGPIRFTVSSRRGDDPVHRVGEKLHLVVETDRDAWLYCFYRQADRRWYKIFPNRYFGEAYLPGNRLHTIPDESYPFTLTFAEPAGIDLVKCFAMTRDVTPELPPELGSLAFEPLPDGMDFRLPQAFRSIANAGVSEASLVITVNR